MIVRIRRSERCWMASLFVLGVLASTACGITDDNQLPPDVQAPETIQTPAGALALYRETLAALPSTLDAVIRTAGIMTDELAALPLPLGIMGPYTELDSRANSSASGSGLARRLHRLRAQAREARNFLAAYAADSSPALQGHLFAVEGYAQMFLAELFCSGIPLSTVDFEGNYTLAAGSTTSEVYQHTISLFDSALGMTEDSVWMQRFAAVGKGRALLGLGQYAAAAMAVAAVPDDYRYQVLFSYGEFASNLTSPPDSAGLLWYGTLSTSSSNNSRRVGAPSVGDQEGATGLAYRTSNDPRTLAVGKGSDLTGHTFFFPRKYTNGAATVANPAVLQPVLFTIVDGIEARLIEAEAALQANSDDGLWLDKLNQLRQTAWSSIVPPDTADGPPPDLVDPGTHDARVDLLFRERAFWLYLTGHRQGDLRRLVRQYVRAPNTVYPSGAYPGSDGVYGEDVVLPMPDQEQQLNPQYTGCFHRNA